MWSDEAYHELGRGIIIATIVANGLILGVLVIAALEYLGRKSRG